MDNFVKPTVQLTGRDGNAFYILGACQKALRKAGLHAEAEAFVAEAMAGDYNHLLATAMKYCDVN